MSPFSGSTNAGQVTLLKNEWGFVAITEKTIKADPKN